MQLIKPSHDSTTAPSSDPASSPPARRDSTFQHYYDKDEIVVPADEWCIDSTSLVQPRCHRKPKGPSRRNATRSVPRFTNPRQLVELQESQKANEILLASIAELERQGRQQQSLVGRVGTQAAEARSEHAKLGSAVRDATSAMEAHAEVVASSTLAAHARESTAPAP